MGMYQIGEAIDKESIKSVGRLTDDVLRKKQARDAILADIITGKDERLLLIIGPCSADNEEAVLEYAHRLAVLQEKVADKLFFVMRVYTAKPRTTGDGYKGLVHHKDDSSKTSLQTAMTAVRRLHSRIITETGLTTADEMLYPSHMNLLDDLVSYHAVGARSVENQEHRFLASGLDVPVGLKNPTSGHLPVMFNAIYAAQHPQHFSYHQTEVATTGNPLAHAILRGGRNSHGENSPNYHYENLQTAIDAYEQMGLENPFIIVDTNHDNSGKHYLEQIRIVHQTLFNRKWDPKIKAYVRGFMIESYLEDGRQEGSVVFGQSITDACLGWDKTETLIKDLYDVLSQ